MSTSEIFLEPHEIEEFVRETKLAPQFFYGYEDQELGICPYLTLYIYHERRTDAQYLEISELMIQLFEEFKALKDLKAL